MAAVDGDVAKEFESKVVVITGAAGIFGSWIADAFIKEGATVVLSDNRVDALHSYVHDGRWPEQQVLIVKTELTEMASLRSLVTEVQYRWESPDIVVNNAGIYPHAALRETDSEQWRRIMDVNLTAPFILIREFSDLMVAKGIQGSFVNILSGASVSVSKNGVPYSVSKAALHMLTRGAALELAQYKIRVNGVAPGFAPGSQVSLLDDAYIERMVASIPLQRMSGPTDAADAVLYLSSERASFITGILLPVDGGRTAGPVTL